jgi:hypothetical protein
LKRRTNVFTLFDFLHINSDLAPEHHAMLGGASGNMSRARLRPAFWSGCSVY